MYQGFKPFGQLLSLILTALTLSACQGKPTEKTFKVRIEKTFSIEEARDIAFENAKRHFDISGYPTEDPDFVDNIKRKKVKSGKFVTIFENGTYGVGGVCSIVSPYYDAHGKLMFLDVDVSSDFKDDNCSRQYPVITHRYAGKDFDDIKKGGLISLSVHVSGQESFTFLPNKKLLWHYKNNDCFLSDGSRCLSRETFLEE